MQDIVSFIQSPVATFGLVIFCLLLLLLVIMQGTSLRQMQKKWHRLLTKSDGGNMEETLSRLLHQIEMSQEKLDEQQFAINRLNQKVAAQVGHLAVLRYNAFGDTGSDLSFSLAFLDDHRNGVVITSIYGREESRTYAKPVQNGTSLYNLSEEEQSVIKKASNS